ncbi:hypothetical protein BC834DRAFT_844189 [Gloeopeniophorella convolvens]|nr:hypothetical protein BC834DRAFT_844189 [Gloeopeniophorella convolvens]
MRFSFAVFALALPALTFAALLPQTQGVMQADVCLPHREACWLNEDCCSGYCLFDGTERGSRGHGTVWDRKGWTYGQNCTCEQWDSSVVSDVIEVASRGNDLLCTRGSQAEKSKREDVQTAVSACPASWLVARRHLRCSSAEARDRPSQRCLPTASERANLLECSAANRLTKKHTKSKRAVGIKYAQFGLAASAASQTIQQAILEQINTRGAPQVAHLHLRSQARHLRDHPEKAEAAADLAQKPRQPERGSRGWSPSTGGAASDINFSVLNATSQREFEIVGGANLSSALRPGGLGEWHKNCRISVDTFWGPCKGNLEGVKTG